MTYRIRALIAAPVVARSIARRLRMPVTDLSPSPPLGMVLLPSPEESSDEELDDTEALFLDAGTERVMAELSRKGPIGYVEADYFGAAGYQASMGWRDGDTTLRPSYTERGVGPLNAALDLVGVTAAEGLDAFDTIGLGRHRRPDDWPAAMAARLRTVGPVEFDLIDHSAAAAANPTTDANPSAEPDTAAADTDTGESVNASTGADEDFGPPTGEDAVGGVPAAGDPSPTPTPRLPAAPARPAVENDVATGPAAPLRMVVLGAPRVWWVPHTLAPTTFPASPAGGTGPAPGPAHGEHPAPAGSDEIKVTTRFQPRTRELLVLLAVHPDGVTREAVIAALWLCSPSRRATNLLNTAFTRLRHAVHTATDGALREIVLAGGGRYRLDPNLADVDYTHLAAAMAARRAARTDTERHRIDRHLIDSYTGVLGEGLSVEWIEPVREAARREVLEAVSSLARSLVGSDAEQTLTLLEIGRTLDPHNEMLYRDIMRLQARLGHHDAVPRTLSLLTACLAELGEQPSPETVQLALRLIHPETAPASRPSGAHPGARPMPQARSDRSAS